MKKRTFIVKVSAETEDDFYLIQSDLEMEIGCCWHGFEIESVEEIDGRRIANSEGNADDKRR